MGKKDRHLNRCDKICEVVQNAGPNFSQPVTFKTGPLVTKRDTLLTRLQELGHAMGNLPRQRGGDRHVSRLLEASLASRQKTKSLWHIQQEVKSRADQHRKELHKDRREKDDDEENADAGGGRDLLL